MEQLSPCKAQWETIAENLHFHSDEIDGIKANLAIMFGGPKGCLREVLSQWLQWAPGDARGSEDRATLEALKRAVDRAGFGIVANKLTLSDPGEP